MNNQPSIFSPRVIIQMLIFVVLIPMLPLIISGRWDWWEAWIYAITYILAFGISRILAAREHPDIIAERARFLQHEDTKSWDKYLAPLVGITGILALLVVGLDERLGWSAAFSTPVKIVAFVIILAGWLLGSYALIENRYFSGVVRIQRERDHHVISTGPYRWVRHPGYVGGLLTYLATPFFLDSTWAILPVILMTIVLVIRTDLEDKTLHEELEGYRDYAQRVRYRLLPGVW